MAGTDVLDFLLQMSSLKERRLSREQQGKVVAIRQGELGLAERKAPYVISNLDAQAGQMSALAEKTRAETKDYLSSDMHELRRLIARNKGLGLKKENVILDQQVKLNKAKLKALDGMPDDQVAMLGWAKEYSIMNDARVKNLGTQVDAANQNLKMMDFGMKQQKQQFDMKKPMYALAGKFGANNPAAEAAAIAALDSNNFPAFMEIASVASEEMRTAKTTEAGEARGLKATQPVTEKRIDAELSEDLWYGPLTLGQMKDAQTTGVAPPETRIVRRPSNIDINRAKINWLDPSRPIERFGFGKGPKFMKISRFEAEQMGVLPEWEAAGSSQEQSPQPSVKDRVKEGVKKTTPVKKKAAEEKMVKDSRGWIKFVSPDGVDTWVNPKDVELAESRGYTLGK